jgi:plastocyanin
VSSHKSCTAKWLLAGALGLGALAIHPSDADEPQPASCSIEGLITYQADEKRPWRYARYYVKPGRKGELAEAVVALRGRGLKSGNAEPPAKAVIDQKNFQFTPETVAVRTGDSVTFTNSDPATHNVQSAGDLAAFNATMPGGGSYTVRLERAGGVREPLIVGCVFHSAMRAWVFVFDHPYYHVTAADGRYRLTGVPPGEYELELSHPAGELRWRQHVQVQAGQALHVDIRLSPDDKK